jgi:hypothetical protein
MRPDDPSPSDSPSESVRTSKQEIAEVLVRYATGIDRRDWDLFRSCFAAECLAEYEGIGTWESADAITDFMVSAHAGMGHTMHPFRTSPSTSTVTATVPSRGAPSTGF